MCGQLPWFVTYVSEYGEYTVLTHPHNDRYAFMDQTNYDVEGVEIVRIEENVMNMREKRSSTRSKLFICIYQRSRDQKKQHFTMAKSNIATYDSVPLY
jgi:hypothetical protein